MAASNWSNTRADTEDWSYHAFREWSGWSVEHTSDRNNPAPSPVDTDRKKVLIKYLKLNDENGLKK